MRFGNAVTVLMAIGGTPPATAARKKKLRHNKPTPPERREQELSMSVDYIMDSSVDPEKSFSDYFHWMPEGKVEICEPYWGSVKVHEEWLDHFPDAEICGTQDDNVCYETDLSCRKQEDDKYSCVTVAKPVDTICDTQEDVCYEKEKTCQYDEDEADNTLTCQTVFSSIGTFCDTNACLDKQACDGSGTCAGGQDNCPNHGAACGSMCMEGTCSFPNEAKSCIKDKCSLEGFCDGVKGVCDAEPKDCDDNNPCTDDSCDLDTGLCANDGNDQNSCADSNMIPKCFDNQVCKKGKCVGEDICPGFGTTCGGTCSIQEEGCVYPDTEVSCYEDGDKCLPGLCAGGDADDASGTCISSPKCVQDENPCTVNECDSITGDCKSHDVKDGTTCGSLPGCFANQVCTDGKCGGEDTCVAEKGSPCGGTCSLTSGECEYTYNEKEVDCWDDGDKNKCRPGFCSEGTCDYEEKVCEEFTCQVGTCQIDTGFCTYENAEPDTHCDTIPCFSNQKCDDKGACMTTGDDNCEDDDEDECTFPTCEATNINGTEQCTGIGYKNSTTFCNTTACFDDQMCDGQGTCMDGRDNCPVNPRLDDTVAIEFRDKCYGTCDTGSGSCTNYTKTDDDDCSGPCDVEDSGYCLSGSCTNTTDKDCNPTDDVCYATCDGSTGNCDDFDDSNDNECDDTLVCTRGDVCSGGKCEGDFTCDGAFICFEDESGVCGNDSILRSDSSGNFLCCPYTLGPCITGNTTDVPGELQCA